MMMSNSATELSNPILLIGAARSGTKLLRSIINSSSSVSAIPYDINYLWRYGNEHAEDDAIPASLATSEVCRVIRKQVFRAANRPRSGVIVEKTVSNALRIPFVSRVMPDARYVFLIRDGREVTESAMRCWRTPPKLGYLWKKMACYPWRHCASYAAKRFVGLGSQLISRSHAAKSWGPRYPGIDRDVSRHPLAYVCARQWQECVHSFERHRQNLPAERVYEVRYEDLIAAPDKTAIELADWLGLPDASFVGAYARTTVSGSRVGLWAGLSGADLAIATELLQPTLQRWGYLDRDNRQVA